MMTQPERGMGTGQLETRQEISVHTMELAPETDSCNRFAPGACSLISNQFDIREQNSGAKVLLRNIFLARNRWCRRWCFAPGACCRSVLREQAPSCVLALRELAPETDSCNR